MATDHYGRASDEEKRYFNVLYSYCVSQCIVRVYDSLIYEYK